MSKNKIEIIILIIIVTFGINYGIFTYYVQPQYQKLAAAKVQLSEKQIKLNQLIVKKGQLVSLKGENEKLKKQAEELNVLTSKQVDTPQLIYDFYMSCNKYMIKGEDMSFQLLNEANPQNSSPNSTIQGNQQQSTVPQTSTSTSNPPQGNTSQNATQSFAANDKGAGVNVVKLTITLKVSGEKKRIEEYIKNLYSITNRKLNVKSITLTPKDEFKPEITIPSVNIEPNTIPSVSVSPNVITPGSDQTQGIFSIAKATNLQAEIVFNQYILVDGTNSEIVNNYQSNGIKTGFESISDMFGTAKGK